MCVVRATSSTVQPWRSAAKTANSRSQFGVARRWRERTGSRHPLLARGERAVELERGEPLHQRLAEGAADRHHLAHRLHRGAERRLRAGELLERPARDLDHRVVERRLEGGEGLAGDVVGDLVERVADGEQRGDLGDREAGRLRGQRRAARHARVHLDHHPLAGRRVDRELDVRAAGGDADAADHLEGVVAHRLVLAVGERLLRRDGDRVAGVHAHGVEVLDRADDDGVVRGGRASPRARTPSSPGPTPRAARGATGLASSAAATTSSSSSRL